MRFVHAAPLLLVSLAGCAADVREIGREPSLAPIGAGMSEGRVEMPIPDVQPERPSGKGSIWPASGGEGLFRDYRAGKPGDVITVRISISDKASVDTKSNRSRTSSRDLGFDLGYNYKFPAGTGSGSADGKAGVDGSTSTDGKGKTSREESIDVRVAAIVSDVLPNGNLVISGRQEVLVNYELRIIGVAGIVRPRDIASDNTIAYERIAEARISYGGRGRAMEVQQPAWGQQIIDILSPM